MLLGWDTDQFPNDVSSATLAMMVILNQKGLGKGGLNFDAKVRRSSNDPYDLFHAHIGGMDTFARGLLIAHDLIENKVFSDVVRDRYKSFESGIGAKIESGKVGFDGLEQWIMKEGKPELESGRQEMLENILNSYICR
jgi:xylose isomerase